MCVIILAVVLRLPSCSVVPPAGELHTGVSSQHFSSRLLCPEAAKTEPQDQLQFSEGEEEYAVKVVLQERTVFFFFLTQQDGKCQRRDVESGEMISVKMNLLLGW